LRSAIVIHTDAVGYAALYAAPTAASVAAIVVPSALSGAMPGSAIVPSSFNRTVRICCIPGPPTLISHTRSRNCLPITCAGSAGSRPMTSGGGGGSGGACA
jgi:hypothetical protein